MTALNPSHGIALSEQGTERAERIEVNIIRLYAMFIVVMIHVASIPAPHYNTITPAEWWISNAFHAFSKGGPPMFTMVSGMLLLAKEQPLGVFFRKRVVKVLIPFVIWALIYLAYRVIAKGEAFSVPWLLRELLQGPPYYHLWFIQMILGLYLATPILRVYVRAASRHNLSYFLIVWALTVGLLPILNRLLNLQIGIQVVITTQFVGYFILGYYLRDIKLTPRQMWIAPFVFVGGILFTEVSSYWLMMNNGGQFDPFFYDNQSLNIIITATALFLFIKSLPFEALIQQYPRLRQWIVSLSACSFGVYFVHVIVMELLAEGTFGMRLSVLAFNPLFAIPLTTLVTFLMSLIIVLVMKRIPLVRQIVP